MWGPHPPSPPRRPIIDVRWAYPWARPSRTIPAMSVPSRRTRRRVSGAVAAALAAGFLLAAEPAGGSPPPGRLPPVVALQRRQLDWLAARCWREWPGIEGASRTQVGEAIRRIKERLRAMGAAFSPGDGWRIADDAALQRLLDDRRNHRDAEWAGFPGEAYRPIATVAEMVEVIRRATAIATCPGLTEPTVISWVMYESGWSPHASPYASTTGRSTAMGLGQVTRTTYGSPEMVRGRPAALPAEWSEEALSDPVIGLASAIHVLSVKRGSTLRDRLAAYHGSGDPAVDGEYADDILAGSAAIDAYLGEVGVPIDHLTPVQQRRLLDRLHAAIGR